MLNSSNLTLRSNLKTGFSFKIFSFKRLTLGFGLGFLEKKFRFKARNVENPSPA